MKKLSSLIFASLITVAACPAFAAPLTTQDAGESAQQVASQTININAADAETLAQLPGIGKGKANAIVQFREQNGAFLSVEDIKEVKGIGDKLYAKLEGLVSVN